MKIIRQFILAIFVFLIISCSQETENDLMKSPIILGHYELDGNAYDESIFHNHGRIVGELISIDDYLGNKNSALQFNNSGYIEIIQIPSIDFNNEISISCNVLINDTSDTWKAIINKWHGIVDEIPRNKDCGFYMGIVPNTTTLRWNISGEYVESLTEFELKKWYQVICTFDGFNANIYINEKFDNTALINGELINTATPIIIGAQSNYVNEINSDYFNGCIDNVIIYNYAVDVN